MIKHLANGETILHSEGHQEVFTKLHGEEKREEGDSGDQEEERGIKRVETNLAAISSLSVLHSLDYPERFIELSREEKWDGGDRGDLAGGGEGRVKKGESNQDSKHTPK